MAASRTLGREVAEFSGLAACAGIHNAPNQAKKARMNHYGWIRIYPNMGAIQIPARQYVWAATHDRPAAKYGQEIKQIIMKGIHEKPTPHTQITEAVYAFGERTGSRLLPGSAQHGTPVFAGNNGYRGLLKKIAKQMEINQFNAIEEVNIIGKKHNAESTKRRKGKDHPLVDTGDMQMAITSWVTKQ